MFNISVPCKYSVIYDLLSLSKEIKMRTTSERFSRLVAWRLVESMCTCWRVMGNAGAIIMFFWVAICMVLALTSNSPVDYQDAVGTTSLAVAAYYSAVVAKMLATIACARQHQFGSNAVTMTSATFTDLCFALALALAGSLAAPMVMSLVGGSSMGIACSMLLAVVALCIMTVMPTAYRVSVAQP